MYTKIWNKDFTLLTLVNFFMCISYYSLISALPVYLSSELHAGKSMIGIVLAAYTIASVLIRPFSGFALDKYGRKQIFLIALMIYCLLFSGYIVVMTVSAMILLRFMHGFTWGATTISASTIAVDLIPPSKRGEGIGYLGLSTTMGMAIGPVFGMFLSHHFGYFIMFLAAFLITLIGLLLAMCINYPPYKPAENNLHFSWRNLFEKHSVLPSLNLLIIMISYGGLLSFIALYGKEIGIVNSANFFLVYAIGIAFSRFISGKEFDKNGPKFIMAFSSILLIIGFLTLAFFQNLTGFYISAIILGLGNGVVFPTSQAMVNNLVDSNRRGAANSTLYTALDLGMGLGMVIAGIISQYATISAAFTFSSGICLISLLFFLFFVSNHYYKFYIPIAETANPPKKCL